MFEDHTVMLIGAGMNYLLTAIKDRLNETSLTVRVSGIDIDTMKIDDDIRAIIIYTDIDLINNQKVLVYLKDMVTERDIPVFTVGSEEELEIVRNAIPEHLLIEEYKRPVNIKELSENIEKYVLQMNVTEKKRILVVDDSSVMLHNLKGWLEDKYQVALANSGITAIKSITKMKPDLLLLDYEMPIVDGKQIMQMLRSEIEFADIPIIFLTGKGDRATVMEVMALRPDGYLLKSMRPDEIVQAIDDFFAKQKDTFI
ncbi:MAG: response regulator [Lachnospiraceae bacterium]|nr:response regulator [Lachnospiraceae bacterium]